MVTAVSTDVHEVDLTISPENASGQEEQTTTRKEREAPFVGADIPQLAYEQIGEILREQQSFNLAGYKDLCIKRRIATRIRAVGMSGPEPYIELLKENTEEQRLLMIALSVHVSHFFRNPSTFKVLEKQVLPELAENAERLSSKLRIWSVGCSNGEEPYSLALLCKKVLAEDDLWTVIGTDLSPDALQRAKRGCYNKSQLQEVPAEQLQNFFVAQEKHYCLVEEVKKAVRFFRHDILSDRPFYRADLILCRNLLIYFSRAQQKRILQVLAAALSPGGYLVLGRAETLVSSSRQEFRCVDAAERIYQRLEKEESLLSTTDFSS